MSNIFSPERLLQLTPHEFRRAIQRLMVQNGFEAFSVDGSGDGGADLYCERDGERWIIQSKWKKNGLISPNVIDEILNARYRYNTHKAIIATNQRLSQAGKKKLQKLHVEGIEMAVWEGTDLYNICNQSPEILEKKKLRPYQIQAVDSIDFDLKKNNKSLLYLATGLGKTVIAGQIIRKKFEDNPNSKVLVLAHMVDLVEQLQRALWGDIPLSVPSQIIDGSSKPDDLSGLTVATDKGAYSYIKAGYRPDLVVIDECHHVGGDNLYSKIIEELDGIPLLGVTATPWRGDGYSIEETFGKSSYLCGIEDGLKNNYLTPVDYKLYCDNINWDYIPEISKNGYTIKNLNKKLFIPQRDESIIDALLNTWENVLVPKGIVFCQSISHAKILHDMAKKYDIWRESEIIHSEMDKQERRMAIINFRNKGCPLLFAVDILNEGVDVPNVNIVCFARVTHSRKIFIQQLGRGLRLSPGKESVTVLDFAADVRRMAAISSLNSAVSRDGEIETLSIRRNKIEFTDNRARALVEEWIADAADLETKLDESKLQFPSTV